MSTQRRGIETLISVTGNPRFTVATFPAPPTWTEAALCPQVDQELFFPEKGQNSGPAKKVCQRCPVRAECLDYADQIETGQLGIGTSYVAVGIWGGLAPRERMARRRRLAAGAADREAS